MGGLSTHQRVLGAVIKVAGGVTGGHAHRAAHADHHVSKVLADAASEREGLGQVGFHAGRAGFVAELPVNPVHHRAGLVEHRRQTVCHIHRLPPHLRQLRDPIAVLQKRPDPLADRRIPSVLSARGGAGGRRDRQRQIVHADAALDFKAGMRLRQLEVMGEVLKQVGEPPQPGRGQHADQRGNGFLIGKRPGFQTQRVQAFRDGRPVVKSRPVQYRQPRALSCRDESARLSHCCCCCCCISHRACAESERNSSAGQT